jgi:hypothetical protein
METKPEDFRKYASKFKNKKNDRVVTQFKIAENITHLQSIVQAFAGHFSSIFNSPAVYRPRPFCLFFYFFKGSFNIRLRQFSDSAHRIVSVQTKSPALSLMVRQRLLTPLLSHIFNIGVLRGKCPLLWKEAGVVPVFKKDGSALGTNHNLKHF